MKTELFVGAVVRRGEEILLVRQSVGHPLEGQWTIPWGRVDPGESPMAAALREAKEEGGITAAVEGFLGVQELPAPEEGGVALVYLCRHEAGEPKPLDTEVDAAGYFPAAALDSIGRMEPWSLWLLRKLFAGTLRVIPADPTNPLRPTGSFL